MRGLLRRLGVRGGRRQRETASPPPGREAGTEAGVGFKAEAAEAMATGAWSVAVDAYRRLRDHDGGKIATRYDLAKALQRRSLVPFDVVDGAVVSTRPFEREAAFAQAVRELEAVAADPKRVRSTYFLGRHYEYGGRWAQAAATYRLALERLATTDAAWAHNARVAWEFRLAWVTRQLGDAEVAAATATEATTHTGPPAPDPIASRLARDVRPVAGGPAAAAPAESELAQSARPDAATSAAASETGDESAAEPEVSADGAGQTVDPADGEPTAPAGYFDATVTDRGLSISGFVLPGQPDTVDLHLDGRFLCRVTVDPRQPLRAFAITLTHPLLDEFGTDTVLIAHSAEEPLATRDGHRQLAVTVPDGTGKLPVLLDAGHRVNKKGRLSPPDAAAVDPSPAYFRAFAAVEEVFAQHGRPLFLAYGTLLGCHRDGRLIPGDDDFDVAYLSHATDPQGVKDEALDLMAALVRAGFDVRVAIDGRPFHLGANGVGIDVNPLWQYRDRVYGYTGHAVDRAALAATVPLELGEQTVAVPVGAEAFLADTYGPDWRTPAPGFRYYRSESDLKTLRRARLRPSEVAAFTERIATLGTEVTGVGRFGGYAAPDNPDFD